MTRRTASEELAASPLHMLHRAVQAVTEIYQAEMASFDLTARQYAVLVALVHGGGMSQSELVDATGIDRSTMADIVRRMLNKGIIQRKRDAEDARAYEVRVTDEGIRLFKAVAPIIERIESKLLSSLKGKRVEEFVANLALVAGAPGEHSAANGRAVELEARE